uniref:Uncharacterized protein n=1 Tax=Syphacia muris TaxID=451379 RepID=A0A0N5AQ50_9BILA
MMIRQTVNECTGSEYENGKRMVKEKRNGKEGEETAGQQQHCGRTIYGSILNKTVNYYGRNTLTKNDKQSSLK